jgi:hypothetical protein
MADSNGVARVASSFESDFQEFNGRSPTAEETKRHLAFDRLAKTSSLDPATVLLIVDAGRIGSIDNALAAFAETLEQVSQRIDDLAKKPAAIVDGSTCSAQLDAMETRQKEQSAQLRTLDALARRNVPEANEGRVTRDLIIFILAMLVTFASAMVGARFMPPMPITIVAALALGIALTLGYQYLTPIVLRSKRG